MKITRIVNASPNYKFLKMEERNQRIFSKSYNHGADDNLNDRMFQITDLVLYLYSIEHRFVTKGRFTVSKRPIFRANCLTFIPYIYYRAYLLYFEELCF